MSLPPALISYLPTGTSTVTAVLVQRTKILQEENDELYELLKSGEMGKLKEEVRGLRRVVDRLERALKGGVLLRPRWDSFV
jgi:hypothetical protein